MKKISQNRIFVMFSLVLGLLMGSATLMAKTRIDAKVKSNAALKIMVVGLPNNVSSNYFPLVMIAEETGIPADSVVTAYNNAIATNIISANKNGDIEFFMPTHSSAVQAFTSKVVAKGEAVKVADLSDVAKSDYQAALDMNHADYVLLLNQHYLKWQEKPMQTVFHITSYSLFDKDGENGGYPPTKNGDIRSLLCA